MPLRLKDGQSKPSQDKREDPMRLSLDYAQNFALPNSSQVSSKFYFLSLYNLYCFGIVNEGANSHRRYLYGEDLVGKGSHEVVSLLNKYLDENIPLMARTIII